MPTPRTLMNLFSLIQIIFVYIYLQSDPKILTLRSVQSGSDTNVPTCPLRQKMFDKRYRWAIFFALCCLEFGLQIQEQKLLTNLTLSLVCKQAKTLQKRNNFLFLFYFKL